MCWNQSENGNRKVVSRPAKAKSSMLACPIDPCSVYKYKCQDQKRGGDNPSKEDLAVINVAYSLFSEKLESCDLL